MHYYVYIIRCEDGSFYTGYTKDVESRLKHHIGGKGGRYTRMHKPEKLVYMEKFDSRVEAMKREKTIKKLNRRRKLDLINSQIMEKRVEKYTRIRTHGVSNLSRSNNQKLAS